MKQAIKFKSLTYGFSWEDCSPEHYVSTKEWQLAGEAIPHEGDDSAEEMLMGYSRFLETDYVKKPVFWKNAWACLKPRLTKKQQKLRFPDDFMGLMSEMKAYAAAASEERKQYKKEHAEELEKQKAERKEKYGYAMLDGKRQPLGGYLIEGPGVMTARGASPVLGLWKYRVQPEDVTLSWYAAGRDHTAGAPEPPEGHHWKSIDTTRNALHTVSYKVNVGNIDERDKEIRFGATSDVKADADEHKFDKAEKLVKNMSKMLRYIDSSLHSPDRKTRECAVAAWIIAHTAIRVGSKKDLDVSADTVGVSTLKVGNISISK